MNNLVNQLVIYRKDRSVYEIVDQAGKDNYVLRSVSGELLFATRKEFELL